MSYKGSQGSDWGPIKTCFVVQVFLTNQVAVNLDNGYNKEWREVKGGALPLTTRFFRATSVGKTLYVTGGLHVDGVSRIEDWILSWDPIKEKWQKAGHLLTARFTHAAVPLPSSVINSYCIGKK